MIWSLLTCLFFFGAVRVLSAEDEPTHQSAYDVLVGGEDSQTEVSLLFLFYQRVVSEHNGAKCLFYPTCSDFFRRSFIRYGFFWAAVMTIDRIFYRENEGSMRFYPFLKGKDLHYDPVSHNFILNSDEYYLGNDGNP